MGPIREQYSDSCSTLYCQKVSGIIFRRSTVPYPKHRHATADIHIATIESCCNHRGLHSKAFCVQAPGKFK